MKRRVALVTGAARGLGKAIAEALLIEGKDVILADIDGDELEKTVDALKETPGRGYPLMMDVSDNASIASGIEEVKQEFPGVHILVNNAGIMHITPIPEITEEEWERVFAVNLKGAFFLFQRVLPFMEEEGWGRVVNISSLAGRMGGFENGVTYSASKAGLIGLTRALATRVAGKGVTVNALAPGTARTDIVKQFTSEKLRGLEKMVPVGRLGEPADTAAAVCFLVSEKAGFVTGTVLDVNGGMYMG